MSRLIATATLALLAGAALFGVPTPTGATYVASTRNAVSTVSAAADWTPPVVTVRSPGSPVKDTVTVAADATDSGTGVDTVVVQYLAPGASTWTSLCTATAAPYACGWSTKAGPDGSYGLRAVATDKAGYATTSDVLTTTVANNLLVVLADPGDVVRGSVPLTATVYNPGSIAYAVSIEYAVSGTTSWKTLCTVALAPYTCSWTTTGNAFTQGEFYDLRATATAGASATSSAVVPDVQVDNVAPTTVMQDPGTPLRGTVTMTATAADAESGVAQVALQYQRTGTPTWTAMCTPTVDPYTCRYDTTALVDGTYSFRSVATDLAGNTTTSAVVGPRTVDNTVSAVSMEDPGAYLSGTVALTATASSTAGVTSVRIDRAPSGTTTWTSVCTTTAAPYTCRLDTTTLADGLYDFRAVLVDGKGATTASTTMAARRIDNNPLRGYDVQAVNGGATAGRLEAGDQLRLTYTGQVAPASISTGWTGTALSVTVRLRDGMLVGTGGKGDTVDVQRSGATVNLGSVNLRSDYVKNNKAVTFAATMVASTTTVNGTTATVVTLTLGTPTGSGLKTSTATAAMVWTPSGLALGTDGRASSTAPVTELGTLDKDF